MQEIPMVGGFQENTVIDLYNMLQHMDRRYDFDVDKVTGYLKALRVEGLGVFIGGNISDMSMDELAFVTALLVSKYDIDFDDIMELKGVDSNLKSHFINRLLGPDMQKVFLMYGAEDRIDALLEMQLGNTILEQPKEIEVLENEYVVISGEGEKRLKLIREILADEDLEEAIQNDPDMRKGLAIALESVSEEVYKLPTEHFYEFAQLAQTHPEVMKAALDPVKVARKILEEVKKATEYGADEEQLSEYKKALAPLHRAVVHGSKIKEVQGAEQLNELELYDFVEFAQEQAKAKGVTLSDILSGIINALTAVITAPVKPVIGLFTGKEVQKGQSKDDTPGAPPL